MWIVAIKETVQLCKIIEYLFTSTRFRLQFERRDKDLNLAYRADGRNDHALFLTTLERRRDKEAASWSSLLWFHYLAQDSLEGEDEEEDSLNLLYELPLDFVCFVGAKRGGACSSLRLPLLRASDNKLSGVRAVL